jgi:hypothetical protein
MRAVGKWRLAAIAAVLIGIGAMHAAGAQEAGDVARVATQAAKLIDGELGAQHVVMLGEIHGTEEIPAITGELAARWTTGAGKKPLLLGLEAASVDQSRVDRYLASKGTAVDRANLLAGAHWNERIHDGRDSQAMAALIERVRALHATGADISIVMFDAAGKGERDARMASTLRAAIKAHPGSRVLVLTGNVHAMTGKPREMFLDDKPYTPPTTMARHIADLHPVSIEFRALRGDAWTCQETDCSAHALPAASRSMSEPTLQPYEAGEAWDYLMALPRFTASGPAIAPQGRRDAGT